MQEVKAMQPSLAGEFLEARLFLSLGLHASAPYIIASGLLRHWRDLACQWRHVHELSKEVGESVRRSEYVRACGFWCVWISFAVCPSYCWSRLAATLPMADEIMIVVSYHARNLMARMSKNSHSENAIGEWEKEEGGKPHE